MSAGTLAAAATGKNEIAAQVSGLSNAFMVAAFVSLGIVVIAAFMGKAAPTEDSDSPVKETAVAL